MDTLFIDIETIPAQRPDIAAYMEESMRDELAAALDNVKAPANYKDADKIAEFISDKRGQLKAEFTAKLAEKIASTGLDGAFGQVFCIAWAWGDGPVQIAGADDLTGASEARVLRTFFNDMPAGLRRVRVVGHNVAAFDLRFIKQRAMVQAVKPPHSLPFDAKPWDETIFDTMLQFAGIGNRISLDKLALALGIDGKSGMTGADVWPAVQEGRTQEVLDYCRADVELTRRVFHRMTFAEAPAA